MPVKKRLSKVRADRITPEAIDAFSRALKLQKSGKHMKKRPHGAEMTEEYRQARVDLDLALGRKPWEASPLHVCDGPAPSYALDGTVYAQSWPKAQALRKALMEAIR